MDLQAESSDEVEVETTSNEQDLPRQPRKVWLLVTAVVVMLLLGGGLALWVSPSAEERESARITDLILAIETGRTGQTRAILERNPELLTRELRYEYPAICWAVKSGHLEMVELMLELGAEPNARFSLGKTPLQVCAWNKERYDIARLLIERGADARAVDKTDMTILWLAVEQAGWDGSRLPLIKLLLENGADPNRLNASGVCPLHQALKSNLPELVEVLLNGGGEPNMAGDNGEASLLHVAVAYRRDRVIKTLVRHGAALDVKDADGKTPLQLAVEQKKEKIATILRACAEEPEEEAEDEPQPTS